MRPVSLFLTCLADGFYPRTAIAVVKVLERFGCEVSFPADQTCCGQPQYNNGFHSETRELARRMIECFENAPTVVTPSASCAAILREAYPELLDGPWRERAESLAAKTFEFTEFLANELQVDLRAAGARWPGRATFHWSCHNRALGLTDESARLMDRIEGLELVDLEDRDECCGFGGTFAVKFAPTSGAMARAKSERIRATGAPVVIGTESGCSLNLSGCCHRENIPVRFVSLAEVIAESLDLLPRSEAK
jgi:L-lactate dehydrogenase complex protein LldE